MNSSSVRLLKSPLDLGVIQPIKLYLSRMPIGNPLGFDSEFKRILEHRCIYNIHFYLLYRIVLYLYG